MKDLTKEISKIFNNLKKQEATNITNEDKDADLKNEDDDFDLEDEYGGIMRESQINFPIIEKNLDNLSNLLEVYDLSIYLDKNKNSKELDLSNLLLIEEFKFTIDKLKIQKIIKNNEKENYEYKNGRRYSLTDYVNNYDTQKDLNMNEYSQIKKIFMEHFEKNKFNDEKTAFEKKLEKFESSMEMLKIFNPLTNINSEFLYLDNDNNNNVKNTNTNKNES